MQKTSSIPTPLNPHKTRRFIEIVDPSKLYQHRFKRIVTFFIGYIATSLAARFGGSWGRNRFTPERQANRLRVFMEEMGGLWVKIGQILALRRDIFSEPFCDELSRLQNRAHGFPGEHARRIIEEGLGTTIESVFSEFDEQPLAAASVGQAHLARLKDTGAEVVVKVQRPNVRVGFDGDLRFLRAYFKLLDYIRFLPHFRWSEMYTELESAMLEELDYRQEATSLQRMRKLLRAHKVYVPKVYLRYCSDRVLVMEKVTGVYMSEYIDAAVTDPERLKKWCKENDIKPRVVGRKLWLSYTRQIVEDNMYHGDLHPGNILLLRKNRVALIDFGSTGTMDKTLLEKYILVFKAMAAKDYRKVAEMFFLICPSLPNKDRLADARDEIIRMYREFDSMCKIKELPYHQKSANRISGDVSNVCAKYGMPFPWDFLRVSRAGTTLDASLMFLIPKVNFMKLVAQYVDDERERSEKKLRSQKSALAQISGMVEQAAIASKLGENLYLEGEYARNRALSFEGYISKAANLGATIFNVLSGVSLVAAISFIVIYVHQRLDALRVLRGTWFYMLLEKVPRHETTAWLFAFIAALYMVNEFSLVKGVFKEPEPSGSDGDRR